MDIKNARRILILGPPDSGALALVKGLTGKAPIPHPLTEPTFISSSSPINLPTEYTTSTPSASVAPPAITAYQPPTLTLSNPYYTAHIPIWLDEISPTAPAGISAAIEAWAADFRSAEAREVVRAVGAWVVVFRMPEPARALVRGLLEAVAAVLEVQGVQSEDVCLLSVGMPATEVGDSSAGAGEGRGLSTEELDDLCVECGGWEYVDGAAKGRNEFGEVVGIERVREALEANEWEAGDHGGEDYDEEDEQFGDLLGAEDQAGFGEDIGFAFERAQMEREFVDLKMAVQNGDDDPIGEGEERGEERQVEELERMMLKVKAVRDMTAHLPADEREKVARRTVHEVMKTL